MRHAASRLFPPLEMRADGGCRRTAKSSADASPALFTNRWVSSPAHHASHSAAPRC